jgi:2-hydroxyglutarate dehydrogenase
LSGLGTHLTLNLKNEIRFGPDVEWLDPERTEDGEDVPSFWEKKLAVSDERMQLAIDEVKKFLPNVDPSGFVPDCALSLFFFLARAASSTTLGAPRLTRCGRKTDSGIRPKMSARGETSVDFSVTHPRPGFISLQGIESPGLTSSLSIAEYVERLVRKEVWGLGRGTGRTVSEAGRLDAWA